MKFDILKKIKEIKFNFNEYNFDSKNTVLKLCDKIKEIDKLDIETRDLKEKKELEEKLDKTTTTENN